MGPQSCDTFVVLPPLTKYGVVFGKNSDRPKGEVQEVVYFPAAESGTKQCTYIEIESTRPIYAVILSKPSWMWGAEMGANEHGVVIGNEAVWTKDNEGDHDPSVKRLLGMDLVRLGLEMGNSALVALEIITEFLEKYGQGGPCSMNDDGLNYHNSFIIADYKSAWILETSGKHWVAEEITSGYRNISNILTITTKIDKHSTGLQEYAKTKGFWNGLDEFNFAKSFSQDDITGHPRLTAGSNLLKKLTEENNFRETDMFKILRNTEADICCSIESDFPTQGSQVSTISSTKPSVHWFTATPDPSKSVYKPFVFTPNVSISNHTKCSDNSVEGHTLYSLHKTAIIKEGNQVQSLLFNMESDCVKELDGIIETIDGNLSELDELFKDCVETEVKFYR